MPGLGVPPNPGGFGQPYPIDPTQPQPGVPGPFSGQPPQQLGQAVRPPESPLPTEPRQYHEFFRAPRFRWWRSLLALLIFVPSWFVVNLVLVLTAMGFDVASGRIDPTSFLGQSGDPAALTAALMTPLVFLANNVSLATAIPLAGLSAWAALGQRPRWMSSIAGGFRWSLFWWFVAVATPIFALSLVTEVVLGGMPEFTVNGDTVFLIVAILLTTPFQAAGEEYGVRGIITRVVASWFGSRIVGLLVAMVISSLIFMSLHLAANLWLNIYYFMVGVVCSILVWRTGGLEAAVALHVVNNLLGEITLPFGGLETMFDRGAEAVGPEALIQLVFTFTVAAGMLWLAKRRKLSNSAAPAAESSALNPPAPEAGYGETLRSF